MSYILFNYLSTSSLEVLHQKCAPKILEIVQNYIQNIIDKSNSSLTSSHIQVLNQDEISVSVYYQCIKDETTEAAYIVCFICDGNALLSPFYHELDKYTDCLLNNLGSLELFLQKWYYNSIEYVVRVTEYFKTDLSSLLYVALSRNRIDIHASDPESQIVKDTKLFISSCSLKELMYNTEVAFNFNHDPNEAVMIDFDNMIVNYETNKFCSKWAESIVETEADAFRIRQTLEDYKITSNEDMNTFRRLLHSAEADHYALFQGFEFIKLHDNGKILFELLSHESMVYSLDSLENLLNILQKFQLYKDSITSQSL